jgi:hypothetical protein
MKKQLELVLLPTKNKSNIILHNDTNTLKYIINQNSVIEVTMYFIYQELYAISDEKPKIGDYCIDEDYVFGPYEENDIFIDFKGKIVITTDKSLSHIQHDDTVPYPKGTQIFVPRFTNDFINIYIERYNNRQIIEEIEVNYNIMNKGYDKPKDYPYQECEILKINPDNTVDVSLIDKEHICRFCNNNSTISKGLVNIHDIRTSNCSKEFITKFVNCYKCNNCGHSWIPKEGLSTEK